MQALVVYDSKFGNTRQVAVAIAETLGAGAHVRHVAEVEADDLRGLDLLVVGSPTQGGRPTKATQALLKEIPPGGLWGTNFAAFDTRAQAAEQGFFLRTLMRAIGFAAPRIDKSLRAKGGTQASPPEGFLVKASEGPLKDGELDRAMSWARRLPTKTVAAA